MTRRCLKSSLLALAVVGAAMIPAAPAIAAPSAPQRPVGLTSDVLPADHTTWVTTPKFDIKDSSPVWVAKVYCNRDTPAGDQVLYPFTVHEGSGYTWAWRNISTPGVIITFDAWDTESTNNSGLAFYVSNPQTKGNYAWGVSIECQSTDPDSIGSAGTPTAENVTATSATINSTLTNTVSRPQSFKWYVQYGTSWDHYTSTSDAGTGNLNPGDNASSINLTNLKPGTTYHYREVLVSQEEGSYNEASYSGADQTFTTPSN
jgi:hypothetical protein